MPSTRCYAPAPCNVRAAYIAKHCCLSSDIGRPYKNDDTSAAADWDSSLQICHFLRLDANTLLQTFYDCVMQCDPALRGNTATPAPPPRKRARCHADVAADAAYLSKLALQGLKARAELAEAVFTAPCAHHSVTPKRLEHLFAMLPPELHAVAARGYFGPHATEWLLELADAVAVRSSARLAQLLPEQPQISAVLVQCDMKQRSLQMLCCLSQTPHLRSFTLKRSAPPKKCDMAWVRYLSPLTSLQRLEIWACRIERAAFTHIASLMAQLRHLTALVLEGGSSMTSRKEASGFAAFAAALPTMTALKRLALPSHELNTKHDEELLKHAVAAIPRLQCLELRHTGNPSRASSALAEGVAACAGLTALDMSSCHWWEIKQASVRSRAQLAQLALDHADLGAAFPPNQPVSALSHVLMAPMTRALTSLSLQDNLTRLTHADQPWEQLCALTTLQQLCLRRNNFGDEGAATLASHVGALQHLHGLDISECEITMANPLAEALFDLPVLKRLSCAQKEKMVEPFVLPDDAVKRGLQLVRWSQVQVWRGGTIDNP